MVFQCWSCVKHTIHHQIVVYRCTLMAYLTDLAIDEGHMAMHAVSSFLGNNNGISQPIAIRKVPYVSKAIQKTY
jgi:hypothetical protein